MKTNLFLVGLLTLSVLFTSCSEDDGQLPPRGTLEEYIAANDVSDYTMTDSGMYFKVAQEGEGSSISTIDVVNFYTQIFTMDGNLVYDGFKADELWKTSTDEDAVYVPAMIDALLMSSLQDSVVLLAPSELAYGEYGAGSTIRPNEDLMIIMKPVSVDMSIEDYVIENEIVNLAYSNTGLFYSIDDDPGEGATPETGQSVTLNYVGKTLDGVEFDKSGTTPLTFIIGEGRVIEGFDEGVAFFKKGQTGTLYIPYWLAYGNVPVSDKVGAYENLIFEIEVLDIR
ncbi:FKBP-type peptidyl-prolyl cis-trans isomerase [Reichenbachiella ulvae]|uniref:Peptidyl-prolyl cis-trans isomerase n=1 Tax=Reichenbachiella ulvae TaxID=2980104 RepID=A0ABT3CYX9_9BACT|nr:FKBP-type peptidyl-prolyl cis-trans isomerase [Reichenbachiella ulvae]MCV9388862.1 FKBP-type peptidyl-prolyl cis-trans isomerase [Reichenbachiella ulvae]